MNTETKKKEKGGFWSKMFSKDKDKEKEKEKILKEQIKKQYMAKGQHNTAAASSNVNR